MQTQKKALAVFSKQHPIEGDKDKVKTSLIHY